MKTRTGLSTVVTTLIILVVGVLLASVVTYYATNVTMTRTETEDLRFSKKHVWVNDTGAVAAFKLQNLGGRDILLDKVVVRGVESHWSNIWIYRVPSGTSIEADLNITSYATLTGDPVLITGIYYNATTSDIPLISGGEVFVYIKGPGNIQMDDIGTTVSFGVYTSNAQYMTECNVESATSQ